jgi:hypothetical protein
MIDFSAHPLVETTWMAAHLSDSDLCIVDDRWRGDGSSRCFREAMRVIDNSNRHTYNAKAI